MDAIRAQGGRVCSPEYDGVVSLGVPSVADLSAAAGFDVKVKRHARTLEQAVRDLAARYPGDWTCKSAIPQQRLSRSWKAARDAVQAGRPQNHRDFAV
eukprot:6606525-Alexandrium_andersonii.AAC.1